MRAAHATDFESWRGQARALLAARVPPEDVAWEGTGALFGDEVGPAAAPPGTVPRDLVGLLEAAACHRDPARWALMYRVLWRVAGAEGRALLEDPADADVARLRGLARAVDREVHHMHAFVRFQERDDGGGKLYAAWFEPEHDIVRRAAPFFRDRFASMRWIIATPQGAARWDGRELGFEDGPIAQPAPGADATEDLWRRYYAHVFNPARRNPGLMRQHMPRRYWKNLPETRDVGELARPSAVLAQPVAAPRWAQAVHVEPAAGSGPDGCRLCPLHENATQAVDGEGPAGASIMLVGEQPGDEEDLQGRPFVGPAGRVLDRALAEAGLDRASLYVTNAVKHFKWEPRGKRRLHKTPAQREVEACGHWLQAEVARVRPRVIVALGATAAFALTRTKLPIAASRGRALTHAGGARIVVTYHPSAVLRADSRAGEVLAALVEDLRGAAL